MTADEILERLPYTEEELDTLLTQLRALNEAIAQANSSIEQLSEKVPLGDDYYLYVSVKESDSFAELVERLVAYTMKISAPNLSFDRKKITEEILGLYPACTLKQIIDYTTSALLKGAADDSYRQIVKKAAYLLPLGPVYTSGLVKGRKLCLHFWDQMGSISFDSIAGFQAFGKLVRILLFKESPETVDGKFMVRGLEHNEKPPCCIAINEHEIVEMKLFKNGNCHIELTNSAYAYSLAEILCSARPVKV